MNKGGKKIISSITAIRCFITFRSRKIKSSPKVKMLEAIFTLAGEEMEWEKIEEKILGEVREVINMKARNL